MKRQNEKNSPPSWILVLVMLVGLVLLGVGIFQTVDRNKKMKTYETVQGGIVDYEEREGENGVVYGAVYAYIVDGREYTLHDSIFTNKMPRVGERVQVMYDPSAPQEAFVKGAVTTGFFMIILGGVFFAMPLFILMTMITSSGRRMETLKGIFLGLIFAGLGYGLCFGLKQGITFATIFLFLFGSLGLYIVCYGVYDLFKPDKQEESIPENTGSGWQQENVSTSYREIGQEAYGTEQPGEYYEGNAGQFQSGYEENAGQFQGGYEGNTGQFQSAYGKKIEQFQENYGEKIEKTKNVIGKGVNVVSAVGRIIGGIIFTIIPGTMIKPLMDSEVTVVGGTRLTVALFLGIFIMGGLSQVVLGIRMLIKR